MKIWEALEIREKGERLKSESLGMYEQGPKSLLFWLLSDSYVRDERKIEQYTKIISATDWEIEK